jgi:ubiquinone/menaquinone biosynthesis C-methylase UbiE
MGGHLIHPSIPVDDITSVVDIACGTGIWLEEVSEELSKTPLRSGAERSYLGLDISPAMFPPESEQGKIQYGLLDILKPVPEDYRNRFDFVSIRLLCAAIKEVDLEQVFRNAEQIISQLFFSSHSFEILYLNG